MTKKERTPLYLGGKFIEFFFGLAPGEPLRLVGGVCLFFAVLAGSIALGFSLVETTQQQLVLVDLSNEDSSTACSMWWLKGSVFEEYGRGGGRLTCLDPRWDVLLSDANNVYTTGQLALSGQLGCQATPLNTSTSVAAATDPRNWSAIVVGNRAVLYATSRCQPSSILGSLSLSSCSLTPLVDPVDTSQLSALFWRCGGVRLGTNADKLDRFLADQSADSDGYLCTASLNGELLASSCMANQSLIDLPPVTRATTTFTFSSAETVYPAVLNAMQTNIQGSSQYTTLVSVVGDMLACLNTTDSGPFQPTDQRCWSTAQNYCNRLCTLSQALRPDLINVRTAAYFPRWGASVPDCVAVCLALNRSAHTHFIGQLLPDYELASVSEWSLQFLSRCIGVPEGTNAARLSELALQALRVVCLTQGQVDISATTVALNIFVNVISWIGTFQLFVASFIITTFICINVYRNRSLT